MTSTTGTNGTNDRINVQGFSVELVGTPATRISDLLFSSDSATQIATLMQLYSLAQQTPGGTLDLDALAKLDPSLLVRFGLSEDVVKALTARPAPQAHTGQVRAAPLSSPVAPSSPALSPVQPRKGSPVQCQVYMWVDPQDQNQGIRPVQDLVFDENLARVYVKANGGKLVRNQRQQQLAIIPSNAPVHTDGGWVPVNVS